MFCLSCTSEKQKKINSITEALSKLHTPIKMVVLCADNNDDEAISPLSPPLLLCSIQLKNLLGEKVQTKKEV